MPTVYPTLYDSRAVVANLFLTCYDTSGNIVRGRSASGLVSVRNLPGAFQTSTGIVTVDVGIWCIWENAAGIIYNKDFVPVGGGAGGGGSGSSGGVTPTAGTFYIKRGDTEPIIYQIEENDPSGVGQVLDVTGWTGKFKLRATPDTGTVILNQNFYISDALGVLATDGTPGYLAYDWGVAGSRSGETNREGLFVAEFECHRADGTKKTYPTTDDLTNEYIKVRFIPDLDDSGSY